MICAYEFVWWDLKVTRCVLCEINNPENPKHLYNILYNVGPTSSTLVQHCTNVIHMFCVCRIIQHVAVQSLWSPASTAFSALPIKALLLFVMGYHRSIPAITKHLYNICTMSDQRRRRWADVVQMLYKCFVLAGRSMWVRVVFTMRKVGAVVINVK